MSLVAKPGWRHFALIVLLASVVRGGVLFWTTDSLSADPDAYRRIAHCLTIHGVFGLESVDAKTGEASGNPTAFRPPLYPWMISWLTDSQGHASNQRIAIFHWLLGVATSLGTYCVAKKMLRNGQETRACLEVSSDSDAPLPTAGGVALEVRHRRTETTSERENSFSNGFAAVFAGALVALDPLLLRASSLVMTETLAAFLVVLALWLWVHLTESLETQGQTARMIGLACLTGIAFGLAFLCRPTFVLWPLALGGYLVTKGSLQGPVPLQIAHFRMAGGIILAVSAAYVGAWTIRNDRIFDKPIWATTHGGYTLLLGNNPSFYEYLREGDWIRNAWDADFFIARWERRFDADPRSPVFWQAESKSAPNDRFEPPMGEVADDRLAYETAVATIEREPSAFVKACFWRFCRLHSPRPLQTGSQSNTAIYAVTAFYAAIWALALAGMFQLKGSMLQPKWAAGFALWAALASVHCIYWTDMRMRAPLVPFLAILAAMPVVTLQRHFGKCHPSDRQSPP